MHHLFASIGIDIGGHFDADADSDPDTDSDPEISAIPVLFSRQIPGHGRRAYRRSPKPGGARAARAFLVGMPSIFQAQLAPATKCRDFCHALNGVLNE
jgi:hypothetical protein